MDKSQTPPPNGDATQFALRVALQTMKERCQVLQKRINILEDENQELRSNKDDAKHTTTSTLPTTVGFAAENFQLRLQFADLQRQKTQLTEQINMVSTENRKLWSRLSQMAKEQNIKGVSPERGNDPPLPSIARSSVTATNSNQNLIRSKTFTQHSPNPNLRHKMISSDDDVAEEMKELNLEEVALSAGEEMANHTEAELGFSYLNIDENTYAEFGNFNEADFETEAKKCVDNLESIKREALEQRQELRNALKALQLRLTQPTCTECSQKSKKPEMADKSLETDESLNEAFQETHSIQHSESVASNSTTTPRMNFIQEKINADALVKTCPMCGKIFSESVTFQAFCEHVESHFSSDTSDFASMVDNEFDMISHTVGNF